MAERPERLAFLDVTAGSERDGPAVLDLAEFAHEREAAEAMRDIPPGEWPAGIVPLVPPEPREPWLSFLREQRPPIVALNRVEASDQVEAARSSLGAGVVLVARVASGAALHRLPSIAEAVAAGSGASRSGIWYAPVDLAIDFDEDPAHPYFLDGSEVRLAANEWGRSRCLTIARGYDLELWGQVDVSFAAALSVEAFDDVARRARLAGFDRLVVRGRG